MENHQNTRAEIIEEMVAQIYNVQEAARKKRKAPNPLVLEATVMAAIGKVEHSVQAERDEELQEIALLLQRREMETSSGAARNAYLHAAHIVLAVSEPFKELKVSRFNWPSLAVLGATFIVLGLVAYNVWSHHA